MYKYLVAALAWAVLILVLTLTPGKSVPDLTLFDYDKLGHAGIFLIQSYLLIMGFYKKSPGREGIHKYAIIGCTLAILYGFLIEFMQNFIPGRSMEVYDAVANIIGSFFGLVLFYFHNKLVQR